MVNTFMLRNAIGKPLNKIKINPNDLGIVRNKVENILVYTEGEPKDHWEQSSCLQSISRQVDEIVEVLDKMIAEL